MDPITNYLGYAILVAVGFLAGWAVSEIRFAITANKMIKTIDNEIKPEKVRESSKKQVLTKEPVKSPKKRPYSEYTKKYRKKHNLTTVRYGNTTHSVRIDHCRRVLGPTGRYHWEVLPEFACNYAWLQKPTATSPSR